MALLGHCLGLVLPPSNRLGNGFQYEPAADTAGFDHGSEPPTTSSRSDASFGSGQSICLSSLSEAVSQTQNPVFDEPQRQLLGQCPNGILVPHTENRAGLPRFLQNTTESNARHL